ncbi:hypothetical protein NC653_009499 [Populus alba x Populus x berolinensis]|uniref:AMP-dependent synthetase/ligase domain-containing protein n=2 Tax=Populus TaxID=3689 RepID=A0A4U5QDU5_POPAL|nr:hypothetical protein NC653_009499 [Populus alba x Populus x berolinensis]TKS08670.1 hypothetical protein D5086_0000099690 [Populus alba]
METPIPCSAEEEHVFRSQHPAVPVERHAYAVVVRDTRRFARALTSLGLRKGHVVIVALPNVAEYGIVALGIMASGGGLGLPIIVLGEMCISTAMNWNELLDAADRSGDILAREEVHQSVLCALPFSSGTTGMSKGVMLTHRNLVANLCSSLFSVDPETVGHVAPLGLIPFFHTYGITGICCATVRNKGKVVVMGRFELRTFLNTLITQEAYGLTEHSCITLTHGDPSKGHGIAKKNSVGFLLPHLELKLIDPETGRSPELRANVTSLLGMTFTNFSKEETTIDTDGWLRTGQ